MHCKLGTYLNCSAAIASDKNVSEHYQLYKVEVSSILDNEHDLMVIGVLVHNFHQQGDEHR